MSRLWWSTFLVATLAVTAQATTLSGIIIYEGAEEGPVRGGGVWHTSLDPAAPPVGVAVSMPPPSFASRLIGDAAGEVAVELRDGGPSYYQPGKNLFTLFWQSNPGQPLGRVTVNIFFNDDTVSPGISVVAPVWPGIGFTYFRRNTAPSLLSLYLRDVDNTADLVYGDRDYKVTLTAVMVANPGALGAVDRVGQTALHADGVTDAVAIIELTVVPVVAPTPRPAAPAVGGGLPVLKGPSVAIEGGARPGTRPGDLAGSEAWRAAADNGAARRAAPTETSDAAEEQTATPVPMKTTPTGSSQPAATASAPQPEITPTPQQTRSTTAPRLLGTPTGTAGAPPTATPSPASTAARRKSPRASRHN